MPPPPAAGVVFPLDDQGKRSTTSINQGAFAAAAKAIDPKLAASVTEEKKWRGKYTKHIGAHVEAGLKTPEAAIKSAQAGLDYLHTTMQFVRGEKSMTLREAMKTLTPATSPFHTHVIKGARKPGASPLEVPYNGKLLSGDALEAQVEKWVRLGVIELSTGASIMQAAQNPGWRDLSDLHICMLGASSAMGPFPLLMNMGANVIAVDIDRAGIWEKLIKTAKEGCGTLILPTKEKLGANASDEEVAKVAGCNLLTETPEVYSWLASVRKERANKQLCVGAYAYLDADKFVMISCAMDAIIEKLIADTQFPKPALAYLCTPTDFHVCPATARDAAMDNLRKSPTWLSLIASLLSFSPKLALKRNARKLVTAEDGTQFAVVDALVKEQGPNYALAKRLQHWRAMTSREQGCVVSTNVAPSTATASVVSNRLFALAYKGFHYVKPAEVAQPELSNSVMTALLVNDLRSPTSIARPVADGGRPLRNPLELFRDNAFHGGAWRTGYAFGSIGTPAVIAYLFNVGVVKPYLVAYNLAQFVGWSMALAATVQCMAAAGGMPDGVELWKAAGPGISKWQWFAVMEVVHAAVGMVRSPVGTTGVQVFSRLVLVEVLNGLSVKQAEGIAPFIAAMSIAWSVTEVVRYPFYGLGILGMCPKFLTFLRYTLFLVLYPMGVSGEMGVLNKTLPQLATALPETKNWLLRNVLQPGLSSSHSWPTVCAIYALCFPPLYFYMLGQRKKVLGGKPKEPKAKKQ